MKVNPDGSEEYKDPVLRHKQEAVLQKSEITAALQQAFPRVLKTLEKWTQRGSAWAVVQVHTLWLDIARYQPLRGGSYIPLPAAAKNKKAVVNVKNKDDHCDGPFGLPCFKPQKTHRDPPNTQLQMA